MNGAGMATAVLIAAGLLGWAGIAAGQSSAPAVIALPAPGGAPGACMDTGPAAPTRSDAFAAIGSKRRHGAWHRLRAAR